MQQPTVTLSLFEFSGFKNKYWAFTGMQRNHTYFKNVPGLRFHKILGTGGGRGFKWYPNFDVYAVLCSWDSESFADDFLSGHSAFMNYLDHSTSDITLFLSCIKTHGDWSGERPFVEVQDNQYSGPLAVITRATIRKRHLPAFWKRVAKVSDAIREFDENLFSIGIGEWPIVQQATFSVWKDLSSISHYAYQHPLHKEVVHLTRKDNWYKEELFARFVVYKKASQKEGRLFDFEL